MKTSTKWLLRLSLTALALLLANDSGKKNDKLRVKS